MKWRVDFSGDVSALITRIAKEHRVSEEEVLRRALGLYDFLHEEGVVPGGKKDLQIRDASTNKVLQTITF